MATNDKNSETYFFQRLSRKEIWDIHKKVVCNDILKKCEINRRTGDCAFYEGGWDDENNHYYTRYEYSDFELNSPETCGSEDRMQREYFKCMAERFGTEYLIAYLHMKTEIPQEFFADIINKK